jgi:hypothetical protein
MVFNPLLDIRKTKKKEENIRERLKKAEIPSLTVRESDIT